MRNYDYKKAKSIIEENMDSLESAYMGMHEDWFWTAESVFEDGEFVKDLDNDELTIGGIQGSAWATPVIELNFKDGTSVTKKCCVGEPSREKPEWLEFGCLSSSTNEYRSTITVEE